MLGRLRSFAMGVKDRGAFDSDGGLLVSRQVCNGWFVEARARVDVNGVDHIVCTLPGIRRRRMGCFILAGRREQKATVRGEGQTTEERRKGLVGVDVGIADA